MSCSSMKVEIYSPHSVFVGMGGRGVTVFSVEYSGYCLKVFCLATLPLSWSFGQRVQASVVAFFVYTHRPFQAASSSSSKSGIHEAKR